MRYSVAIIIEALDDVQQGEPLEVSQEVRDVLLALHQSLLNDLSSQQTAARITSQSRSFKSAICSLARHYLYDEDAELLNRFLEIEEEEVSGFNFGVQIDE